ncbi:MAG: pyruvate formate-lyase-activating protein [Acetanaerobacterium sp.]
MDLKLTGRVHSVETFGAVDGPGIRFVVFFQGCPMRCLYCHNPDSWEAKSGSEVTVRELLQNILRYKSFIKDGGVTISGGEPLLQHEFARALLAACRGEGLHTAIDTSGCIPLAVCRGAVDEGDLILLDIKAVDTQVSKQLSGMGNENALELLRYCEQVKKPVWIRHVLVPGWTLDPAQAHRMGKLLSGFACVEKVELLPFHKMGEYKWAELGIEYTLGETPPPGQEQIGEIQKILQGYGLKV